MEFNFEFCDVCGTKLVDFIEGQCCGKKCPKCNEEKIVRLIEYLRMLKKMV